MFQKFNCIAVVAVSLLVALSSQFSSAETIRVAIATNEKSVTIEVQGDITTRSGCTVDGVKTYNRQINVTSNARGILINKAYLGCDSVTFTAATPLVLEGRQYEGAITIVRTGPTSVTAINVVDIEAYVAGVIEKEMVPSWPMDALKAQAIASRSYALFQKRKSDSKPYDVESTTASQVFFGSAKTDRARTAVLETAGEVALYNGEVAETFFHASAGGRTESLPNVWEGDARPYLVSRPAKYETDSPNFRWKTTIDAKTIQSQLIAAGYKVGAVRTVRVMDTSNSGRAKSIVIYHDGPGNVLSMSGNRFRIIVGAMKLRSTRFLISHRSGSLFTFQGAGFGHGVGMSQWSAKGMAENGDDYQTIIAHFYPGVTIGSMVTDNEPPSLFARLFGK